jgi:predicted DCC family thiol-disulfide oxidoreductase YuxK
MTIDLGQGNYLLFDGDCGICSYCAEIFERLDHRQLFRVFPYQDFSEDELRRFGLDYQQCDQKLQVITKRGRVHAGAIGVNYFCWQYFPWSVLVALIYLIPVILVAELIIYRWISRNRHRLSQWFGLKACLLKRPT